MFELWEAHLDKLTIHEINMFLLLERGLVVVSSWGIDPRFIKAIERQEGGSEALLRAVKCSVPTADSYAKALEITNRSVAHALSDFVLSGPLMWDFVKFFGARWAPVGAKNDPKNLNKDWVHNVIDIYTQICKDTHESG